MYIHLKQAVSRNLAILGRCLVKCLLPLKLVLIDLYSLKIGCFMKHPFLRWISWNGPLKSVYIFVRNRLFHETMQFYRWTFHEMAP